MEPWNSPDFEGSKDERGIAMFRTAMEVENQGPNVAEIDADASLARMYEQRPLTALAAFSSEITNMPGMNRLFAGSVKISEWNVLRSVVATAWAMIARAKIRGRFITSKGDAGRKQRATDATRWLDGWTAEAQVHDVCGQALRDGLVCRFGVAQLIETPDGKVKPQRCLPFEVTVDYAGALHGEPVVFYRRRPVSKRSLLAQFGRGKPEVRDAIKEARTVDVTGEGTASDMVLVREAWSIPTAKGSGDGWHPIAIDRTTLFVEEWKHPWPPLIFFFWDKPIVGFGGISLAAQLESMQVALNRMLWVERKAMTLMAVPRIAVQKGSLLVSKITNEIGQKIEYTGAEPKPLIWPALPPDFYAERDKLVEQMYGIPGISRHASEGVKAPGAESGVAQREAMEAQNLRIQIYAQQSWEAPIVQLYERAVTMVADIVARNGKYEVEVADHDGVETLDFAKVVKDLKERKVTIYPTGFLPLTPAARIDTILVMLKNGLWDVDRCRQALADYDVDYEMSAENAILQMFVKIFDRMLLEGKPQHPAELDVAHYELALKTATVSIAMYRNSKNPDDARLKLAYAYLDELSDLRKQMQPQAAPQVAQAPEQAAAAIQPVPIAA
jgi:hypothetical protein